MRELNEEIIQKMISQAKMISTAAYSPYSNFPVGAVVLTSDGQLLAGCNVENASYGLTICAERNAIFQMVAQGKQRISAVVVYTPAPTPSAPCGACRQVIHEFGPDALILCVCDGPDVIKKKIFDLLPDSFGPKNLK